jgi:hypothetical protein
MTGARDVMEDAAFGFLSSHCLSGGRKPPILSREVREQNNDTGKICLSARAALGPGKAYPSEGECPDGNERNPRSDQLRAIDTST